MKRLIVAAALLLAFSAPASAKIVAPPSVRAAILRAVVAKAPCSAVRLASSTVPGSGWAIIYTHGTRSGVCASQGGSFFNVVHLSYGRWTYAGSGELPVSCVNYGNVPANIMQDLTGCLPRVIADTLQVKPATFTVTGDGSAYFGGETGKILEPRRYSRREHTYPSLGHLRWNDYTSEHADASGVDWVLYGPATYGLASDRLFQAAGNVQIDLFDPREGVFTRAVIHFGESTFRDPGQKASYVHPSTQTETARESEGSWFW